MGLLDQQMPQQGMQQPMQGGLLGGGMPQQAPSQGGNAMKMAMMLAENPTAEVASGIIAQLKNDNDPQTDELERILEMANGDPQMLKMIADNAIKSMSSQS